MRDIFLLFAMIFTINNIAFGILAGEILSSFFTLPIATQKWDVLMDIFMPVLQFAGSLCSLGEFFCHIWFPKVNLFAAVVCSLKKEG